MTKAYWIVHASVTNANAYAAYVAEDTDIIEHYGGVFLVRGGKAQIIEGEGSLRNVVIEFPSLQKAEECYHSAAYQKAKKFREGAAHFDLTIVEGVAHT